MVKSMSKRIAIFVGSSFGFGLLPLMPGTWGSIPGVVVFWGVYHFVHDESLYRLCLLGWLLLLSGIGYLSLPIICNYKQEEDPKIFTLDEMVGYLIIPLVLGRAYYSPWMLSIGGFFVFRFFDIAKPPGARFLDRRLKGFISVMGDDVVSGLYSAFLIFIMCRIIRI